MSDLGGKSFLELRAEVLPFIPNSRDKLTIEHISKVYCSSKQNVRKGAMLVSNGSVRGLKIGPRKGRTSTVVAFVEAEKTNGRFYKVSMTLSGSPLKWETACVCSAANHERPCKHLCALCFALIALRDHHELTTPPKLFRRKGISRYIDLEDPNEKDSLFFKEAGLGLTWPLILSDMFNEVADHFVTIGGHKRKMQALVAPQARKKKPKKVYCYCRKPDDKKQPMVECSGKTPACLGGWYHIACLERKEKRTLPRTARGGVDGDVLCKLCAVMKDQL